MNYRLLSMVLSIASCVSAAAADRVNVQTYGAFPNDGIDDRQKIQNAVDANPGGHIYFPPGTYNISGHILLRDAAYRLSGAGTQFNGTILAFSPGPPYGDAGIYAEHLGGKTLNIDGLIFRATGGNCGWALWAEFEQPAGSGGNFRTASLSNVKIDASGSGYWLTGIYLNGANHSVLDAIDITGQGDATTDGIFYESNAQNTYGLQATNLTIRRCKTALRTAGRVEAIQVRGFNFTGCGRQGNYAVDLRTIGGGYMQLLGYPTGQSTLETVGAGVRSNMNFSKVSGVRFIHGSPSEIEENATMLYINHESPSLGDQTYSTTVTGCLFNGTNAIGIPAQNGIFLSNTRMVQIQGNTFQDMQPGNGSCIVALGDCRAIRISENAFNNVRNPIYNLAPDVQVR